MIPDDVSPSPELSDEFIANKVQVDDGVALLLTRVFIIVGGVIPYIPQYYEIWTSNNASGFSTYVCLVVITSNVLRIAYWFGHWFDEALLYQSIIITILMLLMLELCLRVERNQATAAGIEVREISITDLDVSNIWQWTNLMSYIEATTLLLITSIGITLIFQNYEYIVEAVGFFALFIESMLGLPQFVKNYNNHSTTGMNVSMVVLWAIGDAFKAYFFFSTLQPLPFRMCATLQLCLDIAIMGQVAYYQ